MSDPETEIKRMEKEIGDRFREDRAKMEDIIRNIAIQGMNHLLRDENDRAVICILVARYLTQRLRS